MRSTFFGLELGRRAIFSQQRALDVTGHNIANANTKGYTRQVADMTASNPYTVPAFNSSLLAGQIGTGVEVEQINRIRDSYIDSQIRKENRTTGDWEARQGVLHKLEVIFNEPSDAGLRTVMDQFWESLQVLSQRPEDLSARSVVLERGTALVETFNHLDRMLIDLEDDLNNTIDLEIQGINNMANQIADLNKQIVTIEAAGQKANDLRDKRDLLLDDLSKLVDISVTEDPTGYVTVKVGGHNYIDNVTVDNINLGTPVTWSDGVTPVDFSGGGKLNGLFYSRDNIVTDYKTQLDTLASDLINQFNGIHSAGYDLNGNQGDFFSGTSAGDIGVVITNPEDIAAAASSPVAPGDNQNAIALVELRHSATFDEDYRSIITQLGIDTQSANRMVDNQNLLLEQLNNKKQEVSGVSLDEEMSNMIRFQHAYNAAARTVTAVDEMLDVIINRMGLAGR